MNKYTKILLIGICSFVGIHYVKGQQNIGKKVQINWKVTPEYNGLDNLDINLVLKNISTSEVDLTEWGLWFNAMFPVLEKKVDTYQITNENGNLFQLRFLNQKIQADDSLVFTYQTQFPIANISTVPNGFYFQEKGNMQNYFAVQNVLYSPIDKTRGQQRVFYSDLYDKNSRLNRSSDYPIIFPSPKSIVIKKGNYVIPNGMAYYADQSFFISDFVKSEMTSIFGTSLSIAAKQSAQLRISRKPNLAEEAYELTISKEGIAIEASSDKGVFYAIQSLKSMLPNVTLDAKKSIEFPFLEVIDEPRFAYRGFMLDIVRNFKDKDVIKKYLDVMSSYKLNVFHLHLIDDEGWRIEIPSLPELTEVGARRSPSFADGNSIHPAYGSGASDTRQYYLSKADFIEILKYANDRFITVIPEIETPGHARAAIKSMETRYHRLKALGKDKEAEEYLLHDFEDTSVYNSAQNFNDNILNPALPSVYRFISKVLDEFKDMYDEAGVDFKTVSMGGDEVPNGVWEKSPKIQALMQENNLSSVYEVWPFYVKRINDICRSKGLSMAGWEEFGMLNKGNGMVVNPDLANKNNLLLDVWNNVIGGGQEDLAYRLANAGYPTVLISASNMYFDMMWNTNFMEPGLKWATYADLYHSFSLLPEDYFANIDSYYSGKALGKEGFKDRIRLNDTGKRNLKGIKGGLFAETVHTESKLDYMVFPRFFALAERAWSPKRHYESEDAFSIDEYEKDYIRLINRIGKVDLVKIENNIQFRLPAVAIKQENNKIYANLEYGDFDVFYTIDGSVPNLESFLYDDQKGVDIKAGEKYVFAVLDKNGRVGQLTRY